MTELMGQILGDRYELLRELGSHPGRRTYLALDRWHYEQVVLKLLLFGGGITWDDFKLFEREVAVLQTLDHPAIPRYLDYFEINTPDLKGFALVQTYIEAKSLALWQAEGRVFSEGDLRLLADRLLDILIYLHSRQPPVIHRDIKPTNILLGDRSGHDLGKVYLVDFGAVQTAIAGSTRTVVGTYGYMPPEQFGGKTLPASDLYALGMTLIYLATATPPDELPQKELRVQFQPLVSLSPPFIRWLEKMVAPALEERFDSATAARHALKQLDRSAEDASLITKTPPYGSRLQVRESPQGLLVHIPPVGLNASLFFLIPFAVAWNGFLVVWYSLAIASGFWLMAVFATGHLAVGLGLIGGILYRLLGWQVLMVSPKDLRFYEHILGFRWRHAKVLPLEVIEEIELQPRGTCRHQEDDRQQLWSKLVIRAGSQEIELTENAPRVTSRDLEWLAYTLGRYLGRRVTQARQDCRST
ncbi:serine/threonine protein kinase [Thermosynechococcus vestitus]|uniref:Serine/threonine protein kinase n=1 Tax=Thermosynechococcus vestitus (strain NIES-2133 / IAM M-273 / BP-1) TaxID=197221 RepID=Q8DJX2_THEVB|nr:serine/threonine-protein kinase [Thermosynechococcus vestitus]BAC08651.1 serine/threonine protein kinase [Thermosynechococcus vestitus BP-1]